MNALKTRRYRVWMIIAVITGALVFMLTRPEVVLVDVAVADVGPIEHAIAYDGKVRVAMRKLVLVPVSSVYRPSTFEPGDTVHMRDVLGWYRAVQLDERAERELGQRELAIDDVLITARSQRDVLEAQQLQAISDEGRAQRLYRSGVLPRTDWERAQLRRDQAVQELQAAELRIDQITHERAAMHMGFTSSLSRGLPIYSPIRGVVLRQHVDVERLLPAGTSVYEVGTFDSADVEADVLSTEAELLRNGMHASIKRGASDVAPAVVQRIEPSAFTKISALGIEEQRVKLVLRPLQALERGDGYRVSGRITLWRKETSLRIPSNALVINGADTSVYVVVDGTAQKRSVRLGVQSRDHAEVVSGIEKGTTVIVNPPSSLRSDSRVTQSE